MRRACTSSWFSFYCTSNHLVSFQNKIQEDTRIKHWLVLSKYLLHSFGDVLFEYVVCINPSIYLRYGFAGHRYCKVSLISAKVNVTMWSFLIIQMPVRCLLFSWKTNDVDVTNTTNSLNTICKRRGAVVSASDSWSVDYCQSWDRAPSNSSVVSLSKKCYSNFLVLVGSRNGFERDLHKQKNWLFHNQTKIN